MAPYCKNYHSEQKDFSERFDREIIRTDNYHLRRSFVNYSAFVVFAGSYLLLQKRGNIRYSFRNAAIYYMAASYVACPENINPFNKTIK